MKILQKIKPHIDKLSKYKYAAWILLLGIALMCFPSEAPKEMPEEDPQIYEADLEEKLEQLLSQVDGAGRVQVLLSLQSGMHHTYQQDMQSNTEDETVQMQSQTVLCREGSDECPVLIGTDYPVYRGAVVICEGADRAKVQLDIIRAVSSLTGLGTDRITVIKMQT